LPSASGEGQDSSIGNKLVAPIAMERLAGAALLVLLAGQPLAAGPAGAADRARAHPVPGAPFSRDLSSVSLADMIAAGLDTGVYRGSPAYLENGSAMEAGFYDTLAVVKQSLDPDGKEWAAVPVAQAAPPPCHEPQPTGYDADSCRYVLALFKDREASDPEAVRRAREAVRRGRDVWFKGTFGDQDLYNVYLADTLIGALPDYSDWLDTRRRDQRFRKYGLINDPDCDAGSEATYWLDDCEDPHSSGVLGFRKYPAPPSDGFDPASSPYEEGEIARQKRFVIGVSCASCHVAFDPTNPPEDPARPAWENLMGGIGNQYIRHAILFSQSLPAEGFFNQLLLAQRPGTSDTSLVANDFIHNPGTINAVMNIRNRPLFEHRMKDPFTGEVGTARTRQVLKGGEDSVGEWLALLRVYVNIGMCAQECWTPRFPEPGALFTYEGQKPFDIAQCARDCPAWNYADAKMPDLMSYLITIGPTYLDKAIDVDGTPGSAFIQAAQVPRGRLVFIESCARCHSSKPPPEVIDANDRAMLNGFYEGHIFGGFHAWQRELPPGYPSSAAFRPYLDAESGLPRQIAAGAQDWLGNDRRTSVLELGVNVCRALHSNHKQGHIFEAFASETYRGSPSPGSLTHRMNPLLPLVGGSSLMENRQTLEGGPGYLRNISLLSVWSSAPLLLNNALGPYPVLPDGTPDTTVRGRVEAFEAAMAELLMSDDPADAPYREPVVWRTPVDIAVPTRSDGKGWMSLSLPAGSPVGHMASVNPHRPWYSQCDDYVENRGHQFGTDLSPSDKQALIEFLKTL